MNISNMKKFLDVIENNKESLRSIVNKYKNIIILGNGGSNAIASHISEDYTKVLKKRCLSFSDAARLTCYTNDYGQDKAFVEFLKDFVIQDTLVILISSSGNSENIVNCAKHCKTYNIPFISLSGFSAVNKLNTYESLLNFHISSQDYGEIECSHEMFLHSII